MNNYLTAHFIMANFDPWPFPSDASICNDLFSLIDRYKKELNKKLVFNLLRCIEGLELKLSSQIVKLIDDREDREDFAQDFFKKMCERLKTSQIEKNVRGYIFLAVRNEALNFLQSKKVKRDKIAILDTSNPTHNPPTGTRTAEEMLNMRTFLHEAKNVVGEEKWQAIDMVYLQALSRKEAAEKLGITRTTLNGQIERGIKTLRVHFDDQFWKYFGND
ncbi:MAG: sigma-70 family RNA polymerase sigma factor [Bacteroidota bacterium]